MADEWLSIVEYARNCKISDMTVRRHIRAGRLRAVLRDGKYFIAMNPQAQERELNGAALAPTPPPPMLSHPQAANEALHNQGASARHQASYTRPQHFQRPRQPERWEAQRPQQRPPFEKQHGSERSGGGERSGEIPWELRQRADNQLIAFCDNSLRQMRKSQAELQSSFEARINALEKQLAAKDAELKAAKVQIEDMSVLLKVLEES